MGAKRPSISFSHVSSANVGIIPQGFVTVSFTPFVWSLNPKKYSNTPLSYRDFYRLIIATL